MLLVSRLELRRFGSICVQLAGRRAILTDITSRRGARLPVEHRTAQGAADVLDASHDQPVEFVPAGRLDLTMDVVGTARSSPHCPPSITLIARAGPGACRVES